MFTRKRIQWPVVKDAELLSVVKVLNDYLLGLEGKGALSLRQAEIYADQGLQFPATQVSSSDANNLDDYEEGTFTPVLTFATPGNLSVVYSQQLGMYTKVGRLVTATFRIATSTFTFTTASGNLVLTGLPFTSSNANANLIWHGSVIWSGITKAGYTQVCPQVNANSSQIIFSASGSGVAAAAVTATDTPTAGSMVLRGTIQYETA